ncbi:hypothetical protein CR513_07087, partial [Mucuna pruriens]
ATSSSSTILFLFVDDVVQRSKIAISLNQSKYALELVVIHWLQILLIDDTPGNPSIKLPSMQGKPFCNEKACKRLVGKLLYFRTTRPNISSLINPIS